DGYSQYMPVPSHIKHWHFLWMDVPVCSSPFPHQVLTFLMIPLTVISSLQEEEIMYNQDKHVKNLCGESSGLNKYF
ncbi:hypothetical protein KI387_026651, partial [Taxus chinensis]